MYCSLFIHCCAFCEVCKFSLNLMIARRVLMQLKKQAFVQEAHMSSFFCIQTLSATPMSLSLTTQHPTTPAAKSHNYQVDR